jgi:hypothetical protein
MTEYDDDLTTQLTRTLTDHSDVMAGSSLGLADVRGRARSIRRRRAATAVVAAAAAVAVIVPTVALAGHTGGRPEPAPATQTPSETTSQTTSETPSQKPGDAFAPLDARALSEGKRPGVAYVAGDTIHLPDGGTGRVYGVSAPVDRFVLLSDGTAVYHTRDDQGRTSVEVTDSGGSQHGPYLAGDGLATNPSRTAAAWVTPDGHVQFWQATHTSPTTVQTPVPGAGPQIIGLSGDCSSAASPCQALVQTSDASTGDVSSLVVSRQGGVDPADQSGLVAVSSVSDTGLRAGYTRIGDGDSCSAVAEGSGSRLWRTCQHSLLAFSPDSDHISADVVFHSGLGSSVFAAYDVASGDLLFEHQSTVKTQASVTTSVWEDDSHMLGTTFQGGKWYVVRFGVDGSMELALGPISGDDVESPIVLSGQR